MLKHDKNWKRYTSIVIKINEEIIIIELDSQERIKNLKDLDQINKPKKKDSKKKRRNINNHKSTKEENNQNNQNDQNEKFEDTKSNENLFFIDSDIDFQNEDFTDYINSYFDFDTDFDL